MEFNVAAGIFHPFATIVNRYYTDSAHTEVEDLSSICMTGLNVYS